MLTLSKINYSKNQQNILKDLGFSIGLGSCLVISGKNGSGKTTLLKIIAGLNSLDSKNNHGNVLWNNEDISNISEDFYADIEYLGHNNFLKKELSVLDNLKFYSRLSQSSILIPSAVKYFRMENILDRKISQLSAGWQKRVLLSKLLYCPSTIWLLDEPTINLDEYGKELLFNLVSSRIKENGIVIIATHDNLFDSISGKITLEDFK